MLFEVELALSLTFSTPCPNYITEIRPSSVYLELLLTFLLRLRLCSRRLQFLSLPGRMG